MAVAVVDSIQCIGIQDDPDEPVPLDLHRVEIMHMPHATYIVPAANSQDDLASTACTHVKGLVLDHGARHPGMPTLLKNCHIMTCNVSLEYEKTEVQSGFFYSNAEEREKLVESERKWLDERCRLVVEFKRKVCKEGEVSHVCSSGLAAIGASISPKFDRCCSAVFCDDKSKRS